MTILTITVSSMLMRGATGEGSEDSFSSPKSSGAAASAGGPSGASASASVEVEAQSYSRVRLEFPNRGRQ